MGKSMKKYTLSLLVVSLSLMGVACKKEKSPELEITVLDSGNQAASNVWVRTSVPQADQARVKSGIIDSVRTDQFGKAFFKYDNTILLRVDAYRQSNQLLDSLSVLLETKRLKKSEDNYYERTMRVPAL